MRLVARTLGVMAALAVSACASLTAEAPLFTAADAAEPSPLVEGVWVEVTDRCSLAIVQAPELLPDACMSFDVRRTAAGWEISDACAQRA